MKNTEDEIVTALYALDRFEGDSAVLTSEDVTITLPKKVLPKKVKEGSVLSLTLATDEAERKRREKKAKDLLNEILKGE